MIPDPKQAEEANTRRRRYITAAQHLRDAMNRSSSDREFTQRQGSQITYVFDTNIFVFFADLRDRRRLTRDIDVLAGVKSTQPVQKVLERITGEYLFSGRLPGQRGSPCYASSQHFDEIIGQCKAIADRLDSSPSVPTKLLERNKDEINDLIDSGKTLRSKLRQLSDFVPRAWIGALDVASHFINATRRSLAGDKPLLVSLDHSEWGRKAGQLRSTDVTRWRKVLRPGQKSPGAIEGDAETLATMVNLYRGDVGSRFPQRKRLYLFVTSDGSLVDAVRREASKLENEGIPFFVRTPSDYLPFLDLHSIQDTENKQLSEQFESVYVALGTALDWLVDDTPARTLAAEGLLNHTALGTLQSAWFRTSSYTTVLAVTRFYERVPRIFEHLREFLTQRSTVRATTRLIEEAAVDVRNGHMTIALESALANLRTREIERGGAITRRVYLRLIGVELNRLIGACSINGFIEEALSEVRIPALTVNALTTYPGRADSQFLAACLFMATERWITAVEFAERAEKIYSAQQAQNAIAGEAAYLLALALRLSLEDVRQFRRARDLLEGNLTFYRRRRQKTVLNTLRRLRDEIELGSLLVAASVAQEIERAERKRGQRGKDSTFFTGVNVVGQFRHGAERLRAAVDELRDAAPFELREYPGYLSDAESAALVRSIELQALTNLCGACVFERLIPSLGGSAVEGIFGAGDFEVLRALVSSDEKDGKQFRHVDHVYVKALTALRQADSAARQEAARECLDTIAKADEGTTRLPHCDRIEFTFIEKRMNTLWRGG